MMKFEWVIVVVLCLVALGCVPPVVGDLRRKSGVLVIFEWVCLCWVTLAALIVVVYGVVSLVH